jgi:hypothetical protein
MTVAALRDEKAGWQKLSAAGAFNWRVNACPHTGGALVSRGSALHALVWTGADGKQGLYHVLSLDGGRNWERPQRMGNANARHSSLAIAANGVIAAAWDEQRADGAAVKFAMSRDDGRSWTREVTLDSAGASEHPRVVAVREGFVVLWTQRSADWTSVLKEARLGLDGSMLQAAEVIPAGK